MLRSSIGMCKFRHFNNFAANKNSKQLFIEYVSKWFERVEFQSHKIEKVWFIHRLKWYDLKRMILTSPMATVQMCSPTVAWHSHADEFEVVRLTFLCWYVNMCMYVNVHVVCLRTESENAIVCILNAFIFTWTDWLFYRLLWFFSFSSHSNVEISEMAWKWSHVELCRSNINTIGQP